MCLDLFADEDLKQYATVQKLERYPEELVERLQVLPRFPLLYVGGLENQPEILEVARTHHDLLGNSADAIATVRNPAELAKAIRLAQVQMPEWRTATEPPEANGEWILRPLFGSGGRGIQVWNDAAAASAILDEPHGFQKRIAGTSYSAVFIAAREVGDVRFVGVTEQLIGLNECNAGLFQWAGNIGPTTLSVAVEHKMRRVGNLLKWKAGLIGLYGVDFIVTEDEQVFITEVNPRYPASLELLEFATGHQLLHSHIQCFTEIENPPAWNCSATGPLFGKAVLYAPAQFTLDVDLTQTILSYEDFPKLADIPEQGTQFQPGEPVCTVYAQANSAIECRERLLKNVSQLRRHLTFPDAE